MKYFLFLSLIFSNAFAFSGQDGEVDCTYLERAPRENFPGTSYTKLVKRVRGLKKVIPYVDDLEQQGLYGPFSFELDDVRISGNVIEGHIHFLTLQEKRTQIYVSSPTAEVFNILSLTIPSHKRQYEVRCIIRD